MSPLATTDTVLRGGLVVDGTGAPAYRADVRLSGGLIAEIGVIGDVAGATVIDVEGLVVAPGFIDGHTHYDAQVFWDPDLTPSCWQGVTTVLTSNCGFGIAPLRPDQRETIALTLENVEGMAAEVLAAGIPWTFETYPQYLDAVEALPLRINVGTLIGHTPVRYYVMGDAATQRAATPDEVEQMRVIVAEALSVGALGFSTSKSPNHQGVGGGPVPSRLADVEEIRTLAGALGEAGHGILQASPGPGLDPEEFAELSVRTGRPVTWTALFTGMGNSLLGAAGVTATAAELVELTKKLGGRVYPQIANMPQIMQVTLEDPFPFGMLPAFQRVLAAPRDERVAIYSDPEWVAAAREQLPERWRARWAKTTIDESVAHEELRNGPTIAALAEERGQHPFDLVVELSLAENLQTRFRCILGNDDEEELKALMVDPDMFLAVSDGGAHISQICDARYPTQLLRYWVRETGVLTLEQAVWRLSGQPAEILGLTNRGTIATGQAADVVVFDAATVREDDPWRVWDLPAGGDRLIAGATGIHGVWVNGTRIVADGATVDGASPGQLLRGSAPATVTAGGAA
jgi:N-acyl-D-amino-acid deacylase